MRNFGKFISKHFFIYLSVVILIVLLDLLIFFLTFNGTVNSISKDNPIQILEKVSNNLTIQNGEYILSNKCQKDLITDNIWGIEKNTMDNNWDFNDVSYCNIKYTSNGS